VVAYGGAAAGGGGGGGGGGVVSLNTLVGALTVAAGTGINVASAGTTITVSAPLFGTSAQGDVPASGGGTANYLRADGTWAVPPGTGLTTAITTVNTMAGPAITIAAGSGISVSNASNTVTVAGSLFSSTLQGEVAASGGGTTNYLRADGTWAAPAASAPAGSWVLLNTLNASSSAFLTDTTSITSSYDEYEIEFFNCVPTNTAVALQMQVQTGGTFQTTNYVCSITGSFGNTNSTTPNMATEVSGAAILLSGAGVAFWSPQTTAGAGISGSVRINSDPNSATVYKYINGRSCWFGNGFVNLNNAIIAGAWVNTTAAITGLRFLFSAGNISTGRICIYGRKAS
jgi:hypothetical protein